MHLGGDDNLSTRHLQLNKNLTQLYLSFTQSIQFCSIEVIDTILQTDFNDFFVFLVSLRAEVDHVSEGDD